MPAFLAEQLPKVRLHESKLGSAISCRGGREGVPFDDFKALIFWGRP